LDKQVETNTVQTEQQKPAVLRDPNWVYDRNYPGARAVDALVQKAHKALDGYKGPTEEKLIEKARKERKRDKLVILGTANTMKDAPFHDESYDIWTVSTAITHGKQLVKRVTRIFELHCDHKWKNRQNRIPLMNEREVPVYMQKHNPEVPNSVPYPIGTILNKYRDYMTNSISWMIALAIEEGYKEISFYGVHMVTTSEYADEMPSCEYFLGLAEGLGIKVYVPPAADMLKATKLYGYEEYAPGEERLKYRMQDLQKEKAQLEQQHAQLTDVLAQYKGAIEDTKFILGMYER
jgi:hypothetical protein